MVALYAAVARPLGIFYPGEYEYCLLLQGTNQVWVCKR